MSDTSTTTIKLGGKTFNIRPLTLRQLRGVLPAFAKAGSLDHDAVDSAVAVILGAIGRDYPAETADTLLDLESTVPEMTVAVSEIAKLSGLVSSGEAKAA